MRCENCGEELEDDFCPVCGTFAFGAVGLDLWGFW